MNQKVLKTLEYYKIIERLTDCAASEPGKKMCRELTPSSDFNEIVQAQTETADAVTRVRQKGSLSLAGVRDVRDSLKRLEIGSSLSIMELLSVSGLLTCAARAKNYGRHPENTELPDDSLDEMFRTLEPLTNVNSEITRCILGEDEIADDASPGLHHVRRQMKITADKVHTQLNAILNYRGGSLEGSKLYVTLFPCNECAKAIIQAGIQTIVYESDKYANDASTRASKRMLNAAGVRYYQYNPTGRKIEYRV